MGPDSRDGEGCSEGGKSRRPVDDLSAAKKLSAATILPFGGNRLGQVREWLYQLLKHCGESEDHR